MASNLPAEHKLLRTLVLSFGALALAYLLILGSTIFNIIERRSAEAQSRALAGEVSALELRFLALSGRIDPEFGYSLGFVETSSENFATRRSLGSVSLLPNNEL